jgi:hypothetical protein
MKKLTHIAAALANNTLSKRAMTHIKGGADNQNGNNKVGNPVTNIACALDDEKRRERPGGGISTN